jgi:hypothetical protein
VRVRNIDECNAQAHAKSMMVEKGIYEIGRMGRLKKQNEDRVNLLRVEARIGEGGERWLMGSRNVREDRRVYRRRSRKVGKGR